MNRVRFDPSEFGFHVVINDKLFGYISDSMGFYCHKDSLIEEPRRANPDDLITISVKLSEFLVFGKRPPICKKCGGTPYFPGIVDACGNWVRCDRYIHDRRII